MIRKTSFSLSLILLLATSNAHAFSFSSLKDTFSKAKDLAGKAKEVYDSEQFQGALDAGKGLLGGFGGDGEGGGGSEPPCPRTCPAEQAQQQREIAGLQSQIDRDESALLAGNQNFYQRQQGADTVEGRQAAQPATGGASGFSQGLLNVSRGNQGGGGLGGVSQGLQNLASNSGGLFNSFRGNTNNQGQKTALKQRLSTAKNLLQKFKMKFSGQTGG